MPIVLGNMAKFHALTLPSLITSLLVGIAVSFYMWKFVKYSPAVSLRNAGLLFASGFAIFWLGYLLFAFDRNQDFNSAGLANRVTIASALGTALIEIAVVALVCSVFQFRSKMLIFSCAVGAVCAVNCLATLGIAWFWQDAARQRNAVFQSFSTHVHNLPVGSVLLLDGFCRYSGPGVIFEEAWDGTGAVQIGLRNFTLIGDVISPTLSVGDRALYADDPDRYYPYGPRLYVYNVLNQSLVQLGSRQAAQNYFSSMNPNLGADCPEGRSNFGSPIF
jgi:hypothetical protein